MDRRQVLGVVGAFALAAVMGVVGNAAAKSKVAKAAKTCCCGDNCCGGTACCQVGCCGPVCCDDTGCCDSTSGEVAVDTCVKSAECRETDSEAAEAGEPSCCPLSTVEATKPTAQGAL
jgi:hypothetical protein